MCPLLQLERTKTWVARGHKTQGMHPDSRHILQ